MHGSPSLDRVFRVSWGCVTGFSGEWGRQRREMKEAVKWLALGEDIAG